MELGDIASNLSSMESSLDSMAQENRDFNSRMAMNKYYDKYRDANPGLANKSNEEIAELKKDLAEEKGVYTDVADGTSRESFGAELLGSLSDIGNLVSGNSRGGNQTGYIDEKGDYHQRTCFVKGTLVRTREGFTPIEEVKEGQFVLAINEKTGEKSYKRVQQTYIRTADRIFKLIYENGSIIETTATHPFFISGRGWVEAQNLEVGYRSLTSGDNALAIKEIVVDKKNETVYNFTVEENHNYFVGDVEVLVHNEEYRINQINVSPAGLTAANHAYLKFNNGDMSKSDYEEEMKAIQSGKYIDREIGSIITYPGSKNTTNVGGGKVARDEAGKVLIDSSKPVDPNNWNGIDKLSANHVRVKDKLIAGVKVGEDRIEQTWRGDVSSQQTWYGPGSEFKVIKASVMSPYGGVVDIQLSNGEKVRMGHFNKINGEIFNAYKTGQKLPAGTYIGETSSKIGYTTGAHLHIEALNQSYNRDQVLKWMKEKK